MSASPRHRTLLVSAIAAALAFGTVAEAQAQTAAERLAERRAQREGSAARGRAPKAEPDYPNASRQEPGLSASARLTPRINEVAEAQQEGDLAAAEAAAQAVLENDRANAYERAITLRLVSDLLVDSDPARAKDYMRQVLELDGLDNNQHYGTMLMLAQLQLQDDENAEALATMDRFLAETKSDKGEHVALRANILYRLERYGDAIAALEPIVRNNPEAQPQWRQLLLAAYTDADRTADAAALAQEIAASTPGDKRAQLNLAAVYLQADDYPNAISVYERLRAEGQLSEEAEYRNLAALYLNSDGGEANAISVLNEGLEKGALPADDYRTWALLAQAYYFTDQPQQAIEAYRKAAPLDKDGTSYLNLAKALFNEGRNAEAKQAAQQALDKGLPNPDEARRLLAR